MAYPAIGADLAFDLGRRSASAGAVGHGWSTLDGLATARAWSSSKARVSSPPFNVPERPDDPLDSAQSEAGVHNAGMRVIAKDEAGDWTMWRVGRRRLAWRPDYKGWAVDAADETGILLVLNVIPLAFYLLNWAAALLATTIAWPLRATTGKWPVVAYAITTDDKGYRIYIQGRNDADALAHRWALDIMQHGQPQAPAHTARPSASSNRQANT